MNILVTGGAGYIGSILTEELIRQNHKVVVCDNLSMGHREAVHPNAKFVHDDIANKEVIKQILQNDSIDAVMHLAAFASVGESMEKPEKYRQNNYLASVSLLEAMIESNVKKIVFSSTAAVYGEPKKLPLTEEDETLPINPYGESKLGVEKALQEFQQKYDLRFVALRYFNVGGASEINGEWHEPETHLIPDILNTARGKNKVLKLHGNDYPTPDGTCIRDYIHVLDLAKAHILVLKVLETGCGIYNLGTGVGNSVNEVVETARMVTGKPIPVQFIERRPGDPLILTASSEKIKNELGWQPQHNLEEILDSAWKWIQNHPNGYLS
ncbi:MAG: UDP-glucose 4-epimerase GalE [Pyrinomonadaceae bacterium]|nr:UDP-glucose 4-epimerase GalE [Pyrinomonadaceae bacterium]